MGGVLFSNSISIVTVKTKARTKENYLLNYLGELAYLLSVLSVGIKDLSTNNLFQCSLFLLPPAIHRGFQW